MSAGYISAKNINKMKYASGEKRLCLIRVRESYRK
jgi:hypothetical protein